MVVGNNNIIRVAIRWLVNAMDEIVNVWHLRVNFTSAITPDDLSDSIAAWATVQYAPVKPLIADNVVHYDITMYNETMNLSYTPHGVVSGLTGTNTNTMLPQDDSALIVWRTGVPRRLGRKYLPVFGVNTITEGLWNSTFVTTLNTFAGLAELTYDVDGNIALTPGVYVKSPTDFSEYISHVVSSVPSHQDRRKRGLGS